MSKAYEMSQLQRDVSSKLGKLILKPGREKSLLNRHPWVFSGAIQQRPECEDGSLVAVFASDGRRLGSGYYSSRTSIAVRLLALGEEDPLAALDRALERSLAQRERLSLGATTALRLVNGEGDFVPGLVVDRYGDVLVLQIGTLGIHTLRPRIIDWLRRRVSPRVIFEKSTSGARREEGLDLFEGVLWGEEPEPVDVLEYGATFRVQFRESQKTGFFLDQREMRRLVGDISRDQTVLNCFSYTGGFSVSAARGGALRVDSVDVSGSAVELSRVNFELNGLDPVAHGFKVADAFDWLRNCEDRYGVVVLDPPAFAKRKEHVVQACRGYGEINRLGFHLVEPGGILVTSSCSHFVDETLFRQVVFQAARDAGRNVQIVSGHLQAWDHPVSIFHPEGSYLKSLVLRVG